MEGAKTGWQGNTEAEKCSNSGNTAEWTYTNSKWQSITGSIGKYKVKKCKDFNTWMCPIKCKGETEHNHHGHMGWCSDNPSSKNNYLDSTATGVYDANI
jgi:hypothetical protein